MNLPLLNYTALLQNMSANVQGRAAQLIDLSVGSVLRALLEACAAIALWMQWLILQVLAMTRASTSTGSDLDSWMADFSLSRLPGAAATGNVTFSRYSIGVAANIPVNTIVRTSDGSQSFTVLPQPGNSAWTGSGYALLPSVASITLPVKALVAGSAGNVLAGAITLLSAALPGIDTVTNIVALTGGVDAESDTAFRTRFTTYINSRSLATIGAIQNAIASLQLGLRYAVLENVDATGNPLAGNFCVVVDDGSGAPPASLISAASAAVEAVRPIGTSYNVAPPATVPVAIAMAIESNNALTLPTVIQTIQQSLQSWVAALPMGGILAISKLEALAHAADSSVLSVTSTTVNGASADLTAAPNAVFLINTVSVT